MSCPNRVCPYCEEVVQGEANASCCDEVHTYECGDEGKSCPECVQKEEEYWRSYFGIRPGMHPEAVRAQLEAFRPVSTITDEDWQEMRRLK